MVCTLGFIYEGYNGGIHMLLDKSMNNVSYVCFVRFPIRPQPIETCGFYIDYKHRPYILIFLHT